MSSKLKNPDCFRLIGRIDVKGAKLIKGVHLEGLREVGRPEIRSETYYNQGIDELVYVDLVASLYGRSNLRDIVRNCAKRIHVPLTVVGGIRGVKDVEQLLANGADKVGINTAAIADPSLITQVATLFGSQCMVLSIEAKKRSDGSWEALTDCGRENSGTDVVEWARRAQDLGAGEILLTSVDNEGTRKGMDLDLIKSVSEAVDIRIIASGGVGKAHDVLQGCEAGADAIAVADCLHFERLGINEIKTYLLSNSIAVRN